MVNTWWIRQIVAIDSCVNVSQQQSLDSWMSITIFTPSKARSILFPILFRNRSTFARPQFQHTQKVCSFTKMEHKLYIDPYCIYCDSILAYQTCPSVQCTCTCINVYWCKLLFSPQLDQTTLVQGHRQSQRVIQMFKSTSLLMLTPFLPSLGQGMVCQSPPVMWLWQQPALHSLQLSVKMLGPILYMAITLLGTTALLLMSLCNVSYLFDIVALLVPP